MKNIKLLTSLILAVLFAFGSTAIAAEGGKKQGKGGGDILSKLNLSADQQAAIKEFQKSQAGQRKEIASITDKKEKRDKSMELAKAFQAKLKEVLSEEQFAQFQKLQAAQKAKGKGGDKKKGGKKKKSE